MKNAGIRARCWLGRIQGALQLVTWQWLTAATDAQCENALLCFWFSLKYQSWTGSFSSRIVFGQNIWYKLLPLDTPLLSLLKHTTCSERLSWFRVPRQNIKTFFKDPSRRNVFLQVRSVDKISIRFKGIWKTSRTALTLDWPISETLIARVASSTSLPCRAEKSKCSAGPQSLSGE